jgi:hypothetical protein
MPSIPSIPGEAKSSFPLVILKALQNQRVVHRIADSVHQERRPHGIGLHPDLTAPHLRGEESQRCL